MKSQNENNWINVKSTQVARIAHIPETKDTHGTLLMEFTSGGVYSYSSFSNEKFAAMQKAESIGKFIQSEIKGKHPYARHDDANVVGNMLALAKPAAKCPNDTNGDGNCGQATCAVCHPENQPPKEWGIYNLDGGETFWFASSLEEAINDARIEFDCLTASFPEARKVTEEELDKLTVSLVDSTNEEQDSITFREALKERIENDPEIGQFGGE